jgi:hypothetical protein
MKRRRSGLVRVVDRCARCNDSPAVGWPVIPPRIDHGLAGHVLAVCRDCDGQAMGDATPFERFAMGCDPANPIDDREFAERFHADARRVRRTAAHFLGQERYDALLPECRESIEKARAQREEWRARYVATIDEDDGDEDDYPPWDDD